MAQDVRSRATVGRAALATVVALAALAPACGDRPQQPSPPGPPPAPRAVDTAALPEAGVLDAVLRECHGPLRGHMTQVTAVAVLPGGATLQLYAELPDRLRAQSPDGRWLLRDGAVTRLDPQPAPAAPADARRVRALAELLDAAALGPLYRATGCRRLSPASFELTAPGRTPVTLTLRAGTLLPASLASGDTTIVVAEHVRTPVTWIARELEHPALGRCRLTFEARVVWDDDFFTVPGTTGARPAAAPRAARPDRVRMPSPGNRAETRPATPELQPGTPLQWVVVRDPGDWPARAATYAPLHAELERQQQQIAGFPVLFTEGGERWLAAPFRQRPAGPAFAAPPGWSVRAVAAERWLVVFPTDGDVEQRAATGARQLDDALRAQGLKAAGPVTAQPYFHLQEGAPTAAKLAAPVVRVAVAVE